MDLKESLNRFVNSITINNHEIKSFDTIKGTPIDKMQYYKVPIELIKYFENLKVAIIFFEIFQKSEYFLKKNNNEWYSYKAEKFCENLQIRLSTFWLCLHRLRKDKLIETMRIGLWGTNSYRLTPLGKELINKLYNGEKTHLSKTDNYVPSASEFFGYFRECNYKSSDVDRMYKQLYKKNFLNSNGRPIGTRQNIFNYVCKVLNATRINLLYEKLQT
jgi:hypothetical protein